jgi:hypothetical protein
MFSVQGTYWISIALFSDFQSNYPLSYLFEHFNPEIGQVAPPKKTPPQQSAELRPKTVHTDPKPAQKLVTRYASSSTSFPLTIFQVYFCFSHIYTKETLSHSEHQNVGHEEDLYL